jgi:type IV pilus assembly protein PilN
MIRINLLPYVSEKKKESAKNQVIIFLVYLALIIGAIYWYNSHLNGVIADLNAKIDYTKKELDRYQKIVAKVEEIRKQLELLNQKLAVIDDLNAGRGASFRLLDNMTDMIVKERMWLTRFEAVERITVITTGSGKNAKREEKVETHLTIEGIALDNKTVADFMTQLEDATKEMGEEAHNLYSNVKLVTLQHMTLKPNRAQEVINLKRFQVTCQEERPKLAKSETQEAGKS